MKYINPYMCKPADKISINCEVDFKGMRDTKNPVLLEPGKSKYIRGNKED